MIIIFDCETTGLLLHPSAPLSRQPKIIEFGAALMSKETGDVIDTMNVLITPGAQISPEITKLTGIANSDLKDQEDFEFHFPQIQAFFDKADTSFCHNAPFDYGMLSLEYRRIGVENPVFPQNKFCTVGLYTPQFGANMKLPTLYEEVMGEPLEQKHRAMADVLALIEIIQKEKLYFL